MIYSVLSYFNTQYGPEVFLKSKDLLTLNYIDHIPVLMDFYKQGFFLHEFQQLKTVNLLFEIYSPFARGSVELLMLSLVTLDSGYNMNSFFEIMTFFVDKLKAIPDCYKAFHYKSKSLSGASEKLRVVSQFFNTFDLSLPKNELKIKQASKIVSIYELSQSGKRAIISEMRNKFKDAKFQVSNSKLIEENHLM
ncbi:MAG: hypothetical protein GF353_06720 [Candidatus Lokiarchaeota archaeon]|nr:hypothetical protein [Candidatus Lokiarchaeota archaeon]